MLIDANLYKRFPALYATGIFISCAPMMFGWKMGRSTGYSEVYVVFLALPRQVVREYLKLGNYSFLPYPLQASIQYHPINVNK
jgi:hypothetical protein